MKRGLVFDIQRYSIHDGPGIRTTVFLKGCPLHCWWCHNPESQSPAPMIHVTADRCIRCEECVDSCPEGALTATEHGIRTDQDLCARCGRCASACPTTAREVVGRRMSTAELLAEIEKDRPFYDESDGGVTFSGGEPLRQPEFLLEVLRACGERGIHRAVDTAGTAPEEILLAVARQTDLFLYDLKMMDPARHRETTGASNERVLANLRALVVAGSEVRVRIPLVPGINDDDENIDRTAAFLVSLEGRCGVHLLPFHPLAKDKHMRFGMPWRLDGNAGTPGEGMRRIASRLEAFGLDVRIGG